MKWVGFGFIFKRPFRIRLEMRSQEDCRASSRGERVGLGGYGGGFRGVLVVGLAGRGLPSIGKWLFFRRILELSQGNTIIQIP